MAPDEPPDQRDDVIARALGAARPETPRDPAHALRKRAVLAAVLGEALGAPQVGRYVIEARVGAGGMGVVFRARDAETNERVALKLLRPESRPERSRFRREAEILRALHHPQVVRYLGHGVTDDDLDYLVMEWLSGRDLSSRLAEGPLAIPEALRLGVALAGALRAAHLAGVVHRDVKPGNVFLLGDDVEDLRLLDFGIAKGGAPNSATLTATGAMLGSPQYMAPEQLRGANDPRTDVYGLGATLFHALTGRPPFLGEHPAAVLLAVAAEAAPSARALRPELSPAADALLARMLAKDPQDRPRDMAATVLELHDLLHRPAAPREAAMISRTERRFEAAVTAPEDPSEARGEGDAPTGRERAFGTLRGALEECEAESLPTVAVITGPAGSGKSHLLEAIAASLRAGAWTLRSARGGSDDAGAPFSALRAMLDEADEATAPLRAELDALLRDPGEDPRVLADRIQLGWLELLDAWTLRGPLALLLDDASAADGATLRALDRALTHLADRPIAVVVVTRRGPETLAMGTALSEERALHVALRPLGARSAQRLARRWCPGASAQALADLVRLAAGDPGALRELCRGDATDDAPRSLAERVWVRLMSLDPELRRVLRAASVTGRAFWPGVLAPLLDVDAAGPWLRERLDALARGGWIVRAPSSRVRGDPQFEFASELAQRAAYELNTAEDLRRSHAVVARWLAAQTAFGPAVIAHHLRLAGRDEEALPLFLAAARGALACEAPDDVEAHLAAARATARDAATRSAVAELTAQQSFWSGRLDESVRTARAAMEDLAAGSAPWCGAASLAITAAGQRGDNDAVRALAIAVLDAPLRAGDAADARRIALCRAFTQLTLVEGADARLRHAALAEGARSADARAWVGRARATDAAKRSFDEAIDAFVTAHRAHLEAGDRRSAAQVGLYLGSYLVWSGAWARARDTIDDALSTASRLGAGYLVTWGRYALGKLRVELDPCDQALRTLDEVADAAAGSARIRAGALLYGAITLQRAGRWIEAERRARGALAEVPAGPMARASSAALCRSLLAQRRFDEARALGTALQPLSPPGAVSEFDELVMLTRVELAEATGDETARALALSQARAAIEVRASTLAEPLRRNEYLTGPHLVVLTLSR